MSRTKKLFIILLVIMLGGSMSADFSHAQSIADRLGGRILLQVEAYGEAWYVNPVDLRRYYLGRPADAFSVMRELGLGISEKNYYSFNPAAPERLAGRILLRVEARGEAYYVNPVDFNMHYLGRPQDAFSVMREFGLGITDNDLDKIFVYGDRNSYKDADNILIGVPFTPQAPFGNWQNQMFQDGCEEASILMAMRWVTGGSLTREEAQKEIIAISEFELKAYGEFRDRSAADTAQLIRDYYNYHNIELKYDISGADIRNELKSGHIVIVPVNGQKLGNPYFTPPGPINHMLVIIGYDAATQQFIVNDPGTRRGEEYHYNESILGAALRDYPTGHHEPNPAISKKMIVVKPTP